MDELSDAKIDELLRKAYAQEKLLKDGSVEGRVGGLRPPEVPKDDDVYKTTTYKRDKEDPKIVISYEREVLVSGIKHKYVLNKEGGYYDCVGITFVDGHYVSLLDEDQKSG